METTEWAMISKLCDNSACAIRRSERASARVGRLRSFVLAIPLLLVVGGCIERSSKGEMEKLCGGASPSNLMHNLLVRYKPAPEPDLYARAATDVPYVLEHVDPKTLSCFVQEGDAVAVYVAARVFFEEGSELRAQRMLEAHLPDITAAELSEAEIYACRDWRGIDYFTCEAGFADSWLLLGDIAYENLTRDGNADVAERAYEMAAALGYNSAMARVWDIKHWREERGGE